MEINIWSDVRCPFCYIGKHKFEEALQGFKEKDEVKITWHSFELDPSLETDTDIDVFDYFEKAKGMPRAQAQQMMGQITEMAKSVGLAFNFEKSVVANSYDAHRLIQFAKTKGLANEIEEALFKAHFTDGINIDDKKELKTIGLSIGLEEEELEKVLASNAYTQEVEADKSKAASLGITGVPFFVFNNKYAVSGAQPTEVFSQTLATSWEEYAKAQKPLIINQGATCSTDGTCD